MEKQEVKNAIFVDIFRDLHQVTPLHVSIRNGDKDEFSVLIDSFKKKMPELKCVLHACVHKSYSDPDQIISNKIEIIKTLVALHQPCLEEKEEKHQRTPLLMHEIHYKLLECLISHGADVYATKRFEKQTVAHCAATYLNTDEYNNFVLLIIDKNVSNLFNSMDRCGRTPVHDMISKFNVNIETLRLLSQAAKLTFNNEDASSDTELFAAIRAGKDRAFLECMIELGADWKHENKYNIKALYIACVVGNVEATQLLLSLGENPNDTTGVFQRTPLHYVAKYAPQNACQIAGLLLEQGAQVNVIDSEGKTPLQLARIPYNPDATLPYRSVNVDLVNLLKRAEEELPHGASAWHLI